MSRFIAFIAALAFASQPGAAIADIIHIPAINPSGDSIPCHAVLLAKSSCALTYPQNDDTNPGDRFSTLGIDGASQGMLPPTGVPVFQLTTSVGPIGGEPDRTADVHFFGTFTLNITTQQQLGGHTYLLYLLDRDYTPGGLDTWTPVAYATSTSNSMTFAAPAPVLRANHGFVFQVVSCTFVSLDTVSSSKPCPPLRAPAASPLPST